MTEENIKGAILKAIGRQLPLDDFFVILFGSRVSGKNKRYSDYDIGLCGRQPIPLRTFALIEDELEDLPVAVDLVDIKDASETFTRIALREIIVWNSPKRNDFAFTFKS